MLQTVKVFSDRSVVKDTLLEEQCVFLAVSWLPVEGLSNNSHLTLSTHALHTVQVWSWLVSN